MEIPCCPPTSETIIDYKLPPVTKMKIRPAAQNLTPEYIYKYNKAIECMKQLQKDNPNDPRGFMQQANIHCAYCNGAYTYDTQPGQDPFTLQVHNSWLFFPFHRWYLYFYERILGELIGDPNFALPFWNWDNPKGMYIPEYFLDCRSALHDCKRNPDNLKAVVDLGFTGNKNPDQVVTNNLSIMYNEMVAGNADAYGFMGKPYCQGSSGKDTGPGSIERGSHTAVHVFVGDPREPSGEDLGNFYSAVWGMTSSNAISHGSPTGRLLRPPRRRSLDPAKTAPNAETVFPVNLDKIVRVLVPKTKKGKADELLVIEDITVDTTKKFLKFDVFVNDEDDDLTDLDKAAYAGTYAQVPHKSGKNKHNFDQFEAYKLVQPHGCGGR
ncbi:UNVERIFIED_CONTAM: Polyphenol oxidase I, chloroplastic [Sesamum radiatum]|uniref:Polyphenol oxidase I, chloroplastic n=1 Tax=Sesamum radiatum TaxID=300843 RepID=A0AAW2JGL0_SESRA